MGYLHSSRNFLQSDVSVAAASTKVHPTDFTSEEIEVSDVDEIRVQGKATGANASATGKVTFKLAASLDGVKWDTDYFATLELTLNGTTEVVTSDLIDVTGIRVIRLQAIQNEDASYAANSANLRWGKSYGTVL